VGFAKPPANHHGHLSKLCPAMLAWLQHPWHAAGVMRKLVITK